MDAHVGRMTSSRDDGKHADLMALEKFSVVMDRAVRIPGTKIEFGLDALVGLVPGVGDALTGIMAYGTIIAAMRHRVPTRVVVQMVVNTLVDMGIGTVPLVGDVLDVFYKSNVKNVELLLRHRDSVQAPREVPALVKGLVGFVALAAVGVVVLVGLAAYGIVRALVS